MVAVHRNCTLDNSTCDTVSALTSLRSLELMELGDSELGDVSLLSKLTSLTNFVYSKKDGSQCMLETALPL